jgi:leucyl aminopeptidase (aminopeptidase T)
MDPVWDGIAARMVEGLDVKPGQLVQVRVQAQRPEAVDAVVLDLERAGATPLLEWLPSDLHARLLREVDPALLGQWDRRRLDFMERVDAVVGLADQSLRADDLPPEALNA